MAELRCYARILKVRSVQTFNRRTLKLFFELASETASSFDPGGCLSRECCAG
jgi:hypothetical protein